MVIVIVCDRCLRSPVRVNGDLCLACNDLLYGRQFYNQQYGTGQWPPPMHTQYMSPPPRTSYDSAGRQHMPHFEHEQDRYYRPMQFNEENRYYQPAQPMNPYPHSYYEPPQPAYSARPQVFEPMQSENANLRTSGSKPSKWFTPDPIVQHALRNPEEAMKPCPLLNSWPSITFEQYEASADFLAHNRMLLDQDVEKIMDCNPIPNRRLQAVYELMRLINTWRQQLDSLLEKSKQQQQQQQDSIPVPPIKPPTPPPRWPNSRMPGRQNRRHQTRRRFSERPLA